MKRTGDVRSRFVAIFLDFFKRLPPSLERLQLGISLRVALSRTLHLPSRDPLPNFLDLFPPPASRLSFIFLSSCHQGIEISRILRTILELYLHARDRAANSLEASRDPNSRYSLNGSTRRKNRTRRAKSPVGRKKSASSLSYLVSNDSASLLANFPPKLLAAGSPHLLAFFFFPFLSSER